ncbi:TPA: ferredoxin [Burkholderia stabilis]|nr:ferredoxin [Burkholderia stabilis]HDR9649738.1 ferredoxin [Burkholderia stabilis]HDR9655479.1 ferredoxin [Burkholderia stabilis]HDR9679804.1 ferredoxin [Burkholderia stabilis]
MNPMIVQIQRDICCGFGNCAGLCPQVFVLDYDTNRAQLVLDAPLADYAAQIAQAASECPTQAIRISQSGDEGGTLHA